MRPKLVQSTLSRNGKLALINDTLGEETLLVDTDTSEVTDLKIKNPVCAAWFDSESDYVYTVSLEKQIDVVAAMFRPCNGDYDKLSCYANIEALKKGTVLWESDNPYSTVWWIPGNTHRVRLLLSRVFAVNLKNCSVVVENAKGAEVATHSVEGTVVGVDGDAEQILVYHVVGQRIGKGTLRCTALSADGKELIRSRNIGPHASPAFWDLSSTVDGTRPFRLRGLQSGDVSHFFTNLAPNKSYWQYQDYEGTGNSLQKHLGVLSIVDKERMNALNRSAWRFDADSFEVFRLIGIDRPDFLINHRGGFLETPCYEIFDAVFDESRSVIIGKKGSDDRKKATICIMTLEKPKAP